MTDVLYEGPIPAPPAIVDAFPNNIVEVLATGLMTGIPSIETILRRPLRVSDPTRSLACFSVDWAPTQLEIGGFGPTLARYDFAIQTLVKEADEEEARRNSAVLAKSVRKMLYSNGALSLQLRGLSETGDGDIERVQRVGITRQQFASNLLNKQMLFYSSTQLWVETETV